MEPPTDHRTGSTRMRHRDDDALVFPRRPNENLTLDVDSGRQARVFADNVTSVGELNMYNNKPSNTNNARILIIGGFCCFLFLLATVSIYTSINQGDTLETRAIDETKIESDALAEDELIEEAAADDAEDIEDCVGEGDGGNTMYGLFKKKPPVDEVIIITEIDLIEGTDVPSEDSVVEEADELSDATMKKDDKEVFVMEVNGVEFEIGISKDGDFDLPDGLILNPKVREHWLLIEKTLGMADYEDEEDESAGDGPEKLEPPPSVEDSKMDDVDQHDQPEMSGNEQPVRMPDGLLFDAPPITGEHEHGEGCDPIPVDVGNSLKELAAGDEIGEDVEKKD